MKWRRSNKQTKKTPSCLNPKSNRGNCFLSISQLTFIALHLFGQPESRERKTEWRRHRGEILVGFLSQASCDWDTSVEVVNLTTVPPLGRFTHYSDGGASSLAKCLPNLIKVWEDVKCWVLGLALLHVGHLHRNSWRENVWCILSLIWQNCATVKWKQYHNLKFIYLCIQLNINFKTFNVILPMLHN